MNNRVIKFRAWDRELKKMIDGLRLCEMYVAQNNSDKYELMQFTGLKDRRGKEIYEGDIVNNNSVVVFSRGRFIPRYNFGTEEEWADEMYQIVIEVFGDIYSNPELLTNPTPSK